MQQTWNKRGVSEYRQAGRGWETCQIKHCHQSSGVWDTTPAFPRTKFKLFGKLSKCNLSAKLLYELSGRPNKTGVQCRLGGPLVLVACPSFCFQLGFCYTEKLLFAAAQNNCILIMLRTVPHPTIIARFRQGMPFVCNTPLSGRTQREPTSSTPLPEKARLGDVSVGIDSLVV